MYPVATFNIACIQSFHSKSFTFVPTFATEPRTLARFSATARSKKWDVAAYEPSRSAFSTALGMPPKFT
jgi:hypothetical protein